MTRAYRILQYTGDVGVHARGASLAEALENLARALFAVMVDLRTVRVRQWATVSVEAADGESLAVDWLNALLYQWETSRVLYRDIRIQRLAQRPGRLRLTARCGGEPLDETRHMTKTHVKAATYHAARVWQHAGAHAADVLLDI